MNFEVNTTPGFERAAKALRKRYRSLIEDLRKFIKSLSENPFQGDELTPGIRKIRMSITSKGKGKSGGARVITYTIIINEQSGRVYLLDIYDKSDFETVDIEILKYIVKKLELD